MARELEALRKENIKLKTRQKKQVSRDENEARPRTNGSTRILIEEPEETVAKRMGRRFAEDEDRDRGVSWDSPRASLANRGHAYPLTTSSNPTTGEDLREMIFRQMKEIGLGVLTKLKRRVGRPYPRHFDNEPFPRRYMVSKFRLFDGVGSKTTPEQHIAHFVTTCGDTANNPAWLLRQFPQSLAGAAFEWYASLGENNINLWEDMEDAFCSKFMVIAQDVTFMDMANLKPKKGEGIVEYITRWRNVSIRCQPPLKEIEQVNIVMRNLPRWIQPYLVPAKITEFQPLVTLVSKYESLSQEG